MRCNPKMNVQIHQKPTTLLLQIVSLNPDAKYNSYLFRCIKCGQQLSRVIGNVSGIVAGGESTNAVFVIEQCKRCHENYSFKREVRRQDGRTMVTLSATPAKISTFHCYLCYTPLLQYREGVILKLPEKQIVTLPTKINCFGQYNYAPCPAFYNFYDLVTEDSAIISTAVQ